MNYLDFRLNPLQSNNAVGARSSGKGGVDEVLKKLYRNRLQMYLTLGDTYAMNPQNVREIFKILDMHGSRINNFDDASKDIRKMLQYLSKPDKDSKTRKVDETSVKRATAMVDDVDLVPTKTPEPEPTPETQETPAEPAKPAEAKTGGGNTDTVFDPYLERIEKKENMGTLDVDMEADPNVTPSNTSITMNDRIIFIITTFVIRMVCLFLVDWMISTGMVETFKDAFLYYTVLYILLLVFVTFVVSNNEVGIQMLMFYMNVSANGYSRILLHIFFMIVFIPILYVVKQNYIFQIARTTSFEYKQRISQSMTGFTFLTWIMTSLVALRF
jgi:hypothetical protein